MTDDQTWFEITAKANFEKWLLPLADQPLRCLQLGVFTGDASVWLMTNLHLAFLRDIDTFKGSDEHDGVDMDEVQRAYFERTVPWRDYRLKTVVAHTRDFLVDSVPSLNEYDFIYVDADHHAPQVLEDAVLAWPLVKPGGMLAFDDYTWADTLPYLQTPKPAIDAFVTVYGDQLDVLECNSQVWVRKK